MPTIVQFRRGTSSQLNAFTGANGELVFDTTLKTLRLHDGSTSGGIELLRKDFSNLITTVTSVTTSATTLDTWATATYRSAKYIISIKDLINNEYQTIEANVVHDGTTAYVQTYGSNYTGASTRMTFSATISSGTLSFKGTGTSNNNTVKFTKVLIPV